MVDNKPNKVIAANAPPTTKRTVLVLTSPIFLRKKPSAKNAGKDKANDIFERGENPFEKAFNEPQSEITNSKPTGIKIGSNDFLSFSMPSTKGIANKAKTPPAIPKI